MLVDGETDGFSASDDVLSFKRELLSQWPDLKDVLEPLDYFLQDAPDDERKYVFLALSMRQLDYLDSILELARRRGLAGYSGVAGESL